VTGVTIAVKIMITMTMMMAMMMMMMTMTMMMTGAFAVNAVASIAATSAINAAVA
jgi:hypothetical protein